jgi:hypothetical protein
MNIKDNRERSGKIFYQNGDIEEGEYTKDNKLIKGWRWKLKKDGTHKKYKVETVVAKKEGGD